MPRGCHRHRSASVSPSPSPSPRPSPCASLDTTPSPSPSNSRRPTVIVDAPHLQPPSHLSITPTLQSPTLFTSTPPATLDKPSFFSRFWSTHNPQQEHQQQRIVVDRRLSCPIPTRARSAGCSSELSLSTECESYAKSKKHHNNNTTNNINNHDHNTMFTSHISMKPDTLIEAAPSRIACITPTLRSRSFTTPGSTCSAWQPTSESYSPSKSPSTSHSRLVITPSGSVPRSTNHSRTHSGHIPTQFLITADEPSSSSSSSSSAYSSSSLSSFTSSSDSDWSRIESRPRSSSLRTVSVAKPSPPSNSFPDPFAVSSQTPGSSWDTDNSWDKRSDNKHQHESSRINNKHDSSRPSSPKDPDVPPLLL